MTPVGSGPIAIPMFMMIFAMRCNCRLLPVFSTCLWCSSAPTSSNVFMPVSFINTNSLCWANAFVPMSAKFQVVPTCRSVISPALVLSWIHSTLPQKCRTRPTPWWLASCLAELLSVYMTCLMSPPSANLRHAIKKSPPHAALSEVHSHMKKRIWSFDLCCCHTWRLHSTGVRR